MRFTINASRIICGMAAGLTLVGLGLLAARLKPYWVARYRGVGADLRGAILVYAPLAGANLSRADLAGANLTGANLAGAWLGPRVAACVRGADLRQARLRSADLRRAVLSFCNLTGADLESANLERAYLEGADLTGADLRGARLCGASLAWRPGPCGLGGAQRALLDVKLGGAELTRAVYDGRTEWPAGFDPAKHGAVLVERLRILGPGRP